MVLLVLFDTFFKCLSNVNLLSNVNPKCFCDDAWETLLLLKRKVGWQNFFSFLEKITSWACLLAKLLIYIKNNNASRMEPWGTPALTLIHEEDCLFSPLFSIVSKTFNKLPDIPFFVIWI